MAVLSDYTSGTITLANGSTAVTGTGTLFDVAKFREGDTLQIQNLTAVIASVNSNTSLTLTSPWTGTSLTNAPYRARYLPDGARVTAQTTTLIELLGNGVLTNLAEIGVEDGKVPVGNAAGQYELKKYVADPNGSLGKLAALTLAANKFLSTDVSANLIQPDIVGSISGGSLMEVGLTANGAYWRFKSGLQITYRITPDLVSINSPAGSQFVNGAAIGPYPHAATFSGEPICFLTSHKVGTPAGHSWAASVSRPTATQSPAMQLFRATASTDAFFASIFCLGQF